MSNGDRNSACCRNFPPPPPSPAFTRFSFPLLNTSWNLSSRQRLMESSEGLLYSLSQASPSAPRSLSASRADRRSAAYASWAGKSGLEGSPASATTLLAASNAWSKPYRTQARKRIGTGKTPPHGVRRKEVVAVKAPSTVRTPYAVGGRAIKTPSAIKTHSVVGGGAMKAPFVGRGGSIPCSGEEMPPSPTCACCVRAERAASSHRHRRPCSQGEATGTSGRGRDDRGVHPVPKGANVFFADSNARPSVAVSSSCRWGGDAVDSGSAPSVGAAARFVGRYAVHDRKR